MREVILKLLDYRKRLNAVADGLRADGLPLAAHLIEVAIVDIDESLLLRDLPDCVEDKRRDFR